MNQPPGARVAVVIPCYKVRDLVPGVIGAIDRDVWRIYVVDDKCPQETGRYVEQRAGDDRVRVIYNPVNLGVGGAVMAGYRAAIVDGADIIVKLDGDGQMDPALIPYFVAPILRREADYTKGNRFYDLAQIGRMPRLRVVGNGVLSVLAKLSTGYWDLFDPTNGFTAIHARMAALLPLERISRRFFFETDMLFRLNTFRAVVVDVPMDARYGDEVSNLRISSIVFEFAGKHFANFLRRIGYNYFLRDVSLASLELLAGTGLLAFGMTFGGWHWRQSLAAGVATPVGTIMIATVAVVSGLQFLLAFFGHDIASVPKRPVHPLAPARRDPA
ncbi:MAG TPA: glycosyltransferase family 2 protein [Vicinamibacterales bacterium]|nr:glycosyltransferase family 2 protein [Vicinamibacterales bacterium]